MIKIVPEATSAVGRMENARFGAVAKPRKRSVFALAVYLALFPIAVTCATSQVAPPASERSTPNAGAAGFSLVSDAFKPDEAIPSRFTCDGESLSPGLSWSGEPQGTAAFALIVDDPDAPAGVFTHWVAFDIPPGVHSLSAGVPNAERLQNGAVQGRDDARKLGYTGPCPPPGSPHHYRFNLYALNAMLDLQPGATKQQVLDAMNGHILGQALLVGTYRRAGQ